MLYFSVYAARACRSAGQNFQALSNIETIKTEISDMFGSQAARPLRRPFPDSTPITSSITPALPSGRLHSRESAECYLDNQ